LHTTKAEYESTRLEKTARLNDGVTLVGGMRVKDVFGNSGGDMRKAGKLLETTASLLFSKRRKKTIETPKITVNTIVFMAGRV